MDREADLIVREMKESALEGLSTQQWRDYCHDVICYRFEKKDSYVVSAIL